MVRFEVSDTAAHAPDMTHIGMTDAEIVSLVSSTHTVGYWRADLETGHVFWSRTHFDLYDMAYTSGPVDLTTAYSRVHPEDLRLMLELMEQAASEKIGFHYVLRLLRPHGPKYVRSAARFRTTAEGREELVGISEEIPDHVRLVGMIGEPAAPHGGQAGPGSALHTPS